MVRTVMWAAGSSHRSIHSHSQRGYTLLELLVVLVIATLLLGLVVPRFFAALPGVELKTSVQQIAALLRQARSQAIAENREVIVVYDPEQRGIRLQDSSRLLRWSESVQMNWQPGGRMLFEEQEKGISFFPDGSSSGGVAGLKTKSQQYQITIQWLTGRVVINGAPDEE